MMEIFIILASIYLALLQLTLSDAVQDAPYFTGNAGDKRVTLGQRITLSWGASGQEPLLYSYRLNDTALDGGATTEDTFYKIDTVTWADVGEYRCIVQNTLGRALSKGAKLFILHFADYTGPEQTTSATAGEAKILTCPPFESYPYPVIKWRYNGQTIFENDRLIQTVDDRLVLLQVESSDQGRYTCYLTNSDLGDVKTSPNVSLTVTGTLPTQPYLSSGFAVPPTDTVFQLGAAEVEMECIINARPLSDLRITWYKDGALLTNQQGHFLTIRNPSLADQGVYRCVATLDNTDFSSVEASANLTAHIPPSISDVGHETVEEAAGSTISLSCMATGVPTPTIKWYYNAEDIETLNNNRFRVESDGSLRLTSIAKSDTGVFQCQAVNEVGEEIVDRYLSVQETAPVITLAPNDTTILEGDVAILQCNAVGAPHPTYQWLKDGTLIASDSYLADSVDLLAGGNLILSDAVRADSGHYTCIATNTLDTANATATLTVYQLTFIAQKPTSVQTILGQTSMLTCVVQHDPLIIPQITWMRDGVNIVPDSRVVIQNSGSLVIQSTNANDMGLYTCLVMSMAGYDEGSANLTVLQKPSKPQNVMAAQSQDMPRTIVVSWTVVFDGNSPLIRYILEQKEDESAFMEVEATIDPSVTEFAVTGLKPSRRYQYQIKAQNSIGVSEMSDPSVVVHLPEEPPDLPPTSLRASATSISSIMAEYAEPPYDSWNGALLGYIIEWRIEGYTDSYRHNVTSYLQTSYELTGLITFTVYEISVAAYNGAGIGAFSTPVNVRTDEGVPTGPPQDVTIIVNSSTSFKYTFSPPPDYLINGVNQGYKLLAWEPGNEANAMVALVARDGSTPSLVGYLSNLEEYTQYEAAVLCYTNAGDGPTNTPVTLTTFQDVPGPVSNLRLDNIYDTSLEVSWDEPLEVNGVLTGYEISWEEENRTLTYDSVVLATHQTSHTITGLTPQTTYQIQVWAETAIGPGPKTTTMISSGVPPALPQPPSNLMISESSVQSRSLRLHFTPGFDGDASITLWTVEALVGQSQTWTVIFSHSDPATRYLDVTGLRPHTEYRLRMIATNVKGSSNASEPSRMILTAQDVPEIAPRDIRVRAYSSTSLRITWVPLDDMYWNGQPVGYHIYWRPSGSQDAEMTFNLASPYSNDYIIHGLEEWTSYDVRMEAYNQEFGGPSSAPGSAWTNEDVPSAGPANIQVLSIHYSEIMVSWGDVPQQDQNGEILGYKVIYRESGGEMMTLDVTNNQTRQEVLSGLKGYTTYTITVLAYTRVGDGAMGDDVPIRTLEWIPSPPVGITFPTVQLSSVSIAWDEPLEPNGPNLEYKVGYRLESAPSSSLVETSVGGSMQHTVTGLQPQQTYFFQVSARTSLGDGHPATALVKTTTDRTSPGAPSKPTVDHIRSRQVRLSWTPPADIGNAPLRYYTVHLRMDSGQWSQHNGYIDPQDVSYTVEGLQPHSRYQFRIKVYNDIGPSPNSPNSDHITTELDVPDEAPTNIGATPVTVTSLRVTWQPPPSTSWNGLLTGFRIQFRQLPSGSYMEDTILDSGMREHELVNLVRYQNYEVKVAATNVKGEGPYSSPVFVYVGEAVPSAPPSGVTVNTASSNQFQISWTPPSVDSQNGGLQGYKVVYWEQLVVMASSRTARSTLTVEQRTKTFPPSTTQVVLEGLDCYTDYAVSVKGFNSAGDGPGSDPVYGKTDEDVPSQVAFLQFNNVRMTSLNASWAPPTHPCGIITQYRLFYQPLQPIDGERTSVMVTLPSDQMYYNAKRLSERVKYLFEVRAETAKHVGPDRAANITTGPQIGGPETPLNVELTKNSDSVTISWEEPYSGNEPITGYLIQSQERGQESWEKISDDIRPDQSQYEIQYSALKAASTYSFRVMAENTISISEPALTEDVSVPSSTANAAQTNFYEQWWFLVIVALVGIIVIILVGATLCMLGRSRLYVERKVHKRMTPDERVSVTEDGGFSSFEMDPSARRSARNGRMHNRGGVYARTNSYTRPPPRPSPGSIQYSEEEESKHYEDVRRRPGASSGALPGEEPGENSSLTEKADLQSLSESLASESEGEEEIDGAHGGAPPSFVNHYASLPGTQSWRRNNHPHNPNAHHHHHSNNHLQQPPPSGASSNAYSYTDSEPDPVSTVMTDGRPAIYLQNNLARMPPGSRVPVHGFSSFV